MTQTSKLQAMARDALQVQDACNLAGVAHSFAWVMSDLLSMGLSTEAANNHPIARVWADKIAHLSGTQSLGALDANIRQSYDWIHSLLDAADPDGKRTCASELAGAEWSPYSTKGAQR